MYAIRSYYVSNSAIYCANKIQIGNNVMIGGSCKLWDTDFHPLSAKERADNPNSAYNTKPIIIGNNVFIGGFSIILVITSYSIHYTKLYEKQMR